LTTRGLDDFEVDTIVERATLGLWTQDHLVIARGGDGAHPVIARSEALVNVCSERSALGGEVKALEELESVGVWRVGVIEAIDPLNSDVRVSIDLPVSTELNRRSVVGIGGVGEETSVETLDVEVNVKGLVGGNLVEILGVREFRSGNVLRRWDLSNRASIARTICEL